MLDTVKEKMLVSIVAVLLAAIFYMHNNNCKILSKVDELSTSVVDVQSKYHAVKAENSELHNKLRKVESAEEIEPEE